MILKSLIRAHRMAAYIAACGERPTPKQWAEIQVGARMFLEAPLPHSLDGTADLELAAEPARVAA